MANLCERIESFIVEKFPLARKQPLTSDTNLLESGIIDSLGILDLVSYLEKDFGIVVADEELVPEHFQSISRLVGFIEHKLSEAAASRQ